MKIELDENSKYSVGDDGFVYNNATDTPLFGSPDIHGYLKVRLYVNKKTFKDYYVHRLVAKYFCDKPLGYTGNLYVEHINADRTDNSASNLRWSIPKDVISKNFKNGLYDSHIKSLRKKIIGTSLISGTVVEFDSITEAAKFISLESPQKALVNISQCLRGLSKSAYCYEWKYK